MHAMDSQPRQRNVLTFRHVYGVYLSNYYCAFTIYKTVQKVVEMGSINNGAVVAVNTQRFFETQGLDERIVFKTCCCIRSCGCLQRGRDLALKTGKAVSKFNTSPELGLPSSDLFFPRRTDLIRSCIWP